MTHFNLNDLRADVADHSDWFIFGFGDHDAMIDFILEALIGIDAYELMSARHSTYKYYVDYAEVWIADQDTGHTIWLG
jgi:hypothetical protein